MERNGVFFDYRNYDIKDFDGVSSLISNELTNTVFWPAHQPSNDYHCIVAYLTKRYDMSHMSDTAEYIKEGAIIGFASMFLLRKIFWPQPIAQVEDVVVDRFLQGIGIGKILVRELLIRAKRLNCKRLQLNCTDNNVKFYEKCGFEKAQNQMRLNL